MQSPALPSIQQTPASLLPQPCVMLQPSHHLVCTCARRMKRKSPRRSGRKLGCHAAACSCEQQGLPTESRTCQLNGPHLFTYKSDDKVFHCLLLPPPPQLLLLLLLLSAPPPLLLRVPTGHGTHARSTSKISPYQMGDKARPAADEILQRLNTDFVVSLLPFPRAPVCGPQAPFPRACARAWYSTGA